MPVANPYVFDRPVTTSDPFAPRYRTLARVAHLLRQGNPLVAVFGAPRMGKTTFLRQLARELCDEFRIVALESAWPTGVGAEGGFAALQHSLEQALQTAPEAGDAGAGNRSTLLLVDGLSALHLVGDAGSELVLAWRAWLEQRPGVHALATVNGRPEGIVLSNAALAAVPAVEIETLALEDTEELLRRPVQSELTFDYEAIRRIWQLTSGQPYFTQLFGHLLIGSRLTQGRVHAHEVGKVTDQVIVSTQALLELLWGKCTPQAQVLLGVANTLRGRHGVVTLLEVQEAAGLQGLSLPASTVDSALAELLSIGVARRMSADSFSIVPAVLRMAVARYRPLQTTLERLRGGRQFMAAREPWWRRGLRWSSVGAWLMAAAFLAMVAVLWNARGGGQRFSMGSSTPTASPGAVAETPASGPVVGRIAYMAKDTPDSTWDVWVMRGDGLDPKRLTEDAGDDTSPAWSPDGKYIAFVSDREGNKEIYRMNADGTEPINLTHHSSEDWTPAYAPDGKNIAFASYRDGNWEIYTMDADGLNPKRLTRSSGADTSPSWSPDGASIAFASNRDGNWELYVMNRDGTETRRLTNDDATDSSPAWSSDGTMIAFESYRDGDMEIYVLSGDGSAVRNASEDHYSNEHAPAWGRGGTRVLYYSNRDGGWDIFSMRPDGTEKANLTLSSTLEQDPAWHE